MPIRRFHPRPADALSGRARFLAAVLLLTACAGPRLPPTPSAAPAEIQTRAALGTPPPEPTPAPRELTVCMASEPSSLYIYGPSEMPAEHVRQAIAEGPVDYAGFTPRPVILLALPSLSNGDLRVTSVPVGNGQTVADAFGNIVTLARGVPMWTVDPATGLPAAQPVTYSGQGSLPAIQLQAVFRLRPDLRWSDGEPLTADDSVFSFQTASSPDTPSGKFDILRTQSYAAGDATTAVWTGIPGWLDADPSDNFWSPLPRHAYGSMSPREMSASPEVNRSPLGWGPFRVAAWDEGRAIVVIRNPHYFRAAEGLPRLDRITFRFVADARAALADVQSGECDVATQDGEWLPLLGAIVDAQAEGRALAQFVEGDQFEHLDFNLLPARGHTGLAADGLFADVRVRQALAYCIDRQAIVDSAWRGTIEVPDAYLPPSHPLYSTASAVRYAFDPGRGRELLEAAGWRVGEDGVRVKEGMRLSLGYALNAPHAQTARQIRLQTATLIRAQLRSNCGVASDLQLLDREAMYERWPQGEVFGRRFDLAEFAWSAAGRQPLCDVYLSSAIPDDANPAGVNDTGYAEPEFDAACLRSLRALDESERQRAGAEALAAFTRDLPSMPLYFDVRVTLTRPGVTGVALRPGGASELWNVENADRSP